MSFKAAHGEIEFSRPLAIDKIPANGFEQTLEAKDKERLSLAERFGLIELPSLTAELKVHPAGLDQTVLVTGSLKADVIQQCVVTLEPLPAHVESFIDVTFMPEAEIGGGAGPADADSEDIEVIVDGAIDLGELVAQQLGIALDPYPRKPGAAYVEAEYGDTEVPKGPMAQIAKLAKKPKDSG